MGDRLAPRVRAAPTFSMSIPLRLLLVEDSEDDVFVIEQHLRRGGYEPISRRVDDASSMRSALRASTWDIVLSDCSMPRFGAPDALAILKEMKLDIPFIIVSGTIAEETAVAAMRAGANDFVLKDKLGRLGPAVEREIREHEVRQAHRRAENELRASEARYRVLFDRSPIPMWVYDIETLAFLAVNEAAVDQYGYRRDEFMTMTTEAFRSSEPPIPGATAFVDPSLSREGGCLHRKKDGTTMTVEIKTHDFDFEGRAARLAVVNDMTERVRATDALRVAEEQLRQAQKMEAVGRFAGGVAHDFNNLLSVVLSYASLLLGDMERANPMRQDLQEIENAGKRAADLTRQLLTFSRQQVLQPQTLDLNDVMAGVSKMLRRIVGEDVELLTFCAPSIGNIHADRGRIEQVIMNLVVNARDAMQHGGKLTIETGNVVLDEAYASRHLGSKAGPHVMLAVSDTGVGMDRATQARIFEPFFTTKGRGKGTGLGLSTVFGIVQQSGGTIWVYSEPGRGTTFKIYFPRAGETATRERASSVPPAVTMRGWETILLVEDDEQVRVVARDILRRSGYRVLEASNAGEAFLVCEREGEIHLLLTDVVLPRTSGSEMADRLRSTRPTMKVLFMSGYTGEAVVRHGLLGSRLPFLQKPLTPESLVRFVRQVLDDAPLVTPP
jgi:two-component system cell cycle sensor histidine kinase/response regulator CckA